MYHTPLHVTRTVHDSVLRELRCNTTTTMAAVPFAERKRPNVLCLFDVDKTLTPARQLVSPEMLSTLRRLREQVVTGFVGGSDINKIGEQLQRPGEQNCASLLTRPR